MTDFFQLWQKLDEHVTSKLN